MYDGPDRRKGDRRKKQTGPNSTWGGFDRRNAGGRREADGPNDPGTNGKTEKYRQREEAKRKRQEKLREERMLKDLGLH